VKLSTFRRPASAIAFLAIFLPSVANAAVYKDYDWCVNSRGAILLTCYVADVLNDAPQDEIQGRRAEMDQRLRYIIEKWM
jgi:hypothetical protein